MGAIGRQRRGTPRVLLALLAVAVATMPTVATRANDTSETGNVAPGPDLTLVRAQIKAKNWAGAQAGLSVIAARVEHADVYNLLGFVHRNQGAHQTALIFYNKALALDPGHKGAHEYLGELFVKVGDMAKAHAHEVALLRLCPNGCEELDDLRAAIAKGPGTATLTD